MGSAQNIHGKPVRRDRCLLLGGALLTLFLLSPCLQAEESRETELAIQKYQETAQTLDLLGTTDPAAHALQSKLQEAASLLRGKKFEQASVLLDAILKEAENLPLTTANARIRFKSVWFDFLSDLVQKLLYLLLFIFFVARRRFFVRLFATERYNLIGYLYMALLFSGFALVLIILDGLRYGKVDWAFFDAPYVLVALIGFLGGIPCGTLAGLLVGFSRGILEAHSWHYLGITLAGGFLAGTIRARIVLLKSRRSLGAAAGALLGLVHGLAVAIVFWNVLPPTLLLFILMIYTLVDGTAIFLCLNTVKNVVRETRLRLLQTDLSRTQLLLYQAQIHPHFLFNALNSIAAVCGRGDAAEADRLITKLSDFIRSTLRRTGQEVLVEEEMTHVRMYLELEKARYRDRLHFVERLHLEDRHRETRIPLLILQPLVENAIRHGLAHKKEGGTVTVEIRSEKDGLSFAVSDDGVGMAADHFDRLLREEGRDSADGLGLGLRNIHERLVGIYGRSAGLVFSGGPGQGSRFAFKIPLS
ncbi:MAG: sensor histidine kinase [Candidatus Omnitrophota bacterium]